MANLASNWTKNMIHLTDLCSGSNVSTFFNPMYHSLKCENLYAKRTFFWNVLYMNV